MRSFRCRTIPLVLMCIGLGLPAAAHVGAHPSVHDTVSGFLERLKDSYDHDELVNLNLEQLKAALTEEERHILGTEHITFRVNVPVVVYIVRDLRLGDEPFWLNELGYEKTDLVVTANRREFDVWRKSFDEGVIGLGVNSLSGGARHYFVAIAPQNPGDTVAITEIYPGQHTLGAFRVGEQPYVEDDTALDGVPAELEGAILLRGNDDRRNDGQILNMLRMTEYPSSEKPDHIVLTWSDDPKTTQTIQWRTNDEVDRGVVIYQKKEDYNSFVRGEPTRVTAETKPLETPDVVNDPVVHRHTAVLTGLEPGTTYVYSVGDGSDDGWTELAEFTTAPDGHEPFSFIYMGDAQNGLERWGSLVKNAFRSRPDAAFYVMAGDLINRGAQRDDWDRLFENAQGVYERRQLVPALGNHEYHGGEPVLYLEQFTLPTNGPDEVTPEKAYSFEYSNALFVILDSNLPVESQSAWLEKTLSESDATWKFAVYHHPAYSSGQGRDNPKVRGVWGALFDKYHVDLALQGHDHAYLRTYPMRGGQRVDSPAEGTIYIVSNSGMKFYEQGSYDYTEVGMTNISTYQALDIYIEGNRLVYRAYDIDGNLKDQFVIEK